MASQVYVLGGYQSDFSQNWARNGQEIFDAFRDTVHAGLQAAALDPSDIEVAHVGNFAAEIFCGQGPPWWFFRRLRSAVLGHPGEPPRSRLCIGQHCRAVCSRRD